MKFDIPRPLKLEHEELHETLVKATQEQGRIGEAAKAVARLLHPHFVKEEAFALPPLALLAPLAKGEYTAEMEGVLALTDQLKAELPQMLTEHRSIVQSLETLAHTARQEGHGEYAAFADALVLHAQSEEEVMYPAALLVGELIRLRLRHQVERGMTLP